MSTPDPKKRANPMASEKKPKKKGRKSKQNIIAIQRTAARNLKDEQGAIKIQLEEDNLAEKEAQLSWFSCRGCLGILRIKCVRRMRRTRQAISHKIQTEIAGTGAKKTKTWKTLRKLWRQSGKTGPRQLARDWVSSHLKKLATQSGAKKKKSKKGTAGIFQKEMAAGCFGLSSFVIHNDGDVMDFFALDFEKEIGAGGSAHVFKAAERSTHINRAIKRITKRYVPDVGMVENEVNIMKSVDHPNIVKLFETFEDDRFFYLVLELCEGGDLLDRLMEVSCFSEAQVIIIVRTILMTLNYLHVNLIVHRDIKPENVMFREHRTDVTTSALRLVDFGFSCRGIEESPQMSTKVGSPFYVAPEVLDGSYDKMCDLWSVGCVAYLLLAGYPPFAGATDAATLTLVKSGKFVFPHEHWKIISKNAKHLIKHLLQADPTKRLSMRKALEHPWIRAKGLPKMEHMKEETVNRLITFHKHHPLRRAAMLAIAYQMEAHDVHSLRELFHGLDVNGDGLVQRTEFMKGIQSCGIDESFVQEMIRSVDADGSGIIDYSEFIAATLDSPQYEKNHGVCLRAFRAFDQDDSGFLTKAEVAEILDLKDQDQQGEVERFFAEVDKNKDGYMDYKEFHQMLIFKIEPNRDTSADALITGGAAEAEEENNEDEERQEDDEHQMAREEQDEEDVQKTARTSRKLSSARSVSKRVAAGGDGEEAGANKDLEKGQKSPTGGSPRSSKGGSPGGSPRSPKGGENAEGEGGADTSKLRAAGETAQDASPEQNSAKNDTTPESGAAPAKGGKVAQSPAESEGSSASSDGSHSDDEGGSESDDSDEVG